jgi:hypothetical protein
LNSRILSDNPSIKDINLIYPGQRLKLRNPAFRSDSAGDGAAPMAEQAAAVSQGVVTYVEGSAIIMPKAAAAKQRLTSNTVVFPGDVIQTMDGGKVELIINRETVVRLRERTRLVLNEFRDAKTASGATRVGFSIGSLWTKMKKFREKAARFELELPTAIAGIHGTVYEATVNRDTSSEVKVFEGEVAVSGGGAKAGGRTERNYEIDGPVEVAGPEEVTLEEWVRIVGRMQRVIIDADGKPREVKPFQKAPDDAWEAWNGRRDVRIAELFKENTE